MNAFKKENVGIEFSVSSLFLSSSKLLLLCSMISKLLARALGSSMFILISFCSYSSSSMSASLKAASRLLSLLSFSFNSSSLIHFGYFMFERMSDPSSMYQELNIIVTIIIPKSPILILSSRPEKFPLAFLRRCIRIMASAADMR